MTEYLDKIDKAILALEALSEENKPSPYISECLQYLKNIQNSFKL